MSVRSASPRTRRPFAGGAAVTDVSAGEVAPPAERP